MVESEAQLLHQRAHLTPQRAEEELVEAAAMMPLADSEDKIPLLREEKNRVAQETLHQAHLTL